MTPFKCIINHEYEIYRLNGVSYVKRFSNLKIIGFFENAEDGLPLLENEKN